MRSLSNLINDSVNNGTHRLRITPVRRICRFSLYLTAALTRQTHTSLSTATKGFIKGMDMSAISECIERIPEWPGNMKNFFTAL